MHVTGLPVPSWKASFPTSPRVAMPAAARHHGQLWGAMVGGNLRVPPRHKGTPQHTASPRPCSPGPARGCPDRAAGGSVKGSHGAGRTRASVRRRPGTSRRHTFALPRGAPIPVPAHSPWGGSVPSSAMTGEAERQAGTHDLGARHLRHPWSHDAPGRGHVCDLSGPRPHLPQWWPGLTTPAGSGTCSQTEPTVECPPGPPATPSLIDRVPPPGTECLRAPRHRLHHGALSPSALPSKQKQNVVILRGGPSALEGSPNMPGFNSTQLPHCSWAPQEGTGPCQPAGRPQAAPGSR